MTKVCFDRFESLIYAREYRGFRCVNGPLCRPFFVISSRIERTIRMAHKFEINRDLVSIFKKVTKKWEIVAVEIRKKLSIAVNYTVFTFFFFSSRDWTRLRKKKKSVTLDFLSAWISFHFTISTYLASAYQKIRERGIATTVQFSRKSHSRIKEMDSRTDGIAEISRSYILRKDISRSVSGCRIGVKQICHEAINVCKFDAVQKCSKSGT